MPSPENKKETHKKELNERRDTKNLLNELAKKIAEEFGIDVSQVKELIRSESNVKLENLKGLVQETELSGEIDFQKLKTVLNGARNVVEKVSRDEIDLLKGSIEENSISPETDFYLSTKIVSPSTLTRLYDPQSLGDQVLGSAIGLLNSTEATIKLLYDIGSGIIKTPYHIYLIVSGKGFYNGVKKV